MPLEHDPFAAPPRREDLILIGAASEGLLRREMARFLAETKDTGMPLHQIVFMARSCLRRMLAENGIAATAVAFARGEGRQRFLQLFEIELHVYSRVLAGSRPLLPLVRPQLLPHR